MSKDNLIPLEVDESMFEEDQAMLSEEQVHQSSRKAKKKKTLKNHQSMKSKSPYDVTLPNIHKKQVMNRDLDELSPERVENSGNPYNPMSYSEN